MHYLLLAVVVLSIAAENVVNKQYNCKVKGQPITFFFAMVSALFAMLFFAVRAGFQFTFATEFLPYSLLFGVSFTAALAGDFMAMRHGPLSLTVLISSYSLIIPTLYGIFGLNETIGVLGIVGLVLLLISIFLIRKKSDDKMQITPKWIVSVLVGFFGNGTCSLAQKLQQTRFNGAYKSEYMIVSLAICAVLMLACSLLFKENISAGWKQTIPYGFLFGVLNGTVNYFAMVLTGMIPNFILFPSVSAGGIVLGFFIAIYIYHEKLTVKQMIGYFMGVVSIVLLNI